MFYDMVYQVFTAVEFCAQDLSNKNDNLEKLILFS